MSNKVEEILKLFWYDDTGMDMEKAKQALHALVVEAIGEDKEIPPIEEIEPNIKKCKTATEIAIYESDYKYRIRTLLAYNQAKAEIRQAVDKLFDKKGEK